MPLRSMHSHLTLVALLGSCLLGTAACGSDAATVAGNAGAGGSSGSGTAGAPNAGKGGSPSTQEQEFTGTFSFNGGATLPCEVSTQLFPATGEFSVLCENDDDDANYRFVQVTFKDEASARIAQSLVLAEPFAFSPSDHPEANAISVNWQDTDGALYADSDSTGSGKVTATGGHNVLKITDVSLSTVSSDATGTVSATVDY